ITWQLKSTPNTTFAVETFASVACHPSGFGEGRVFLSTTPIVLDQTGVGMVETSFPLASFPGDFPTATATATSPSAATSEFSGCVDTKALEEPTTTTTTEPDATTTTTTTQPGATTTTTTSTMTTSTLAAVCVRDPNGLGVDGAGHPHISDRAEGAVVV